MTEMDCDMKCKCMHEFGKSIPLIKKVILKVSKKSSSEISLFLITNIVHYL